MCVYIVLTLLLKFFFEISWQNTKQNPLNQKSMQFAGAPEVERKIDNGDDGVIVSV